MADSTNIIPMPGEPYFAYAARAAGRTVAEHAAVELDCAYSAFAAGVFNRADLDRDLAHIPAEVETCAAYLGADDHTCVRGPLCGDVERHGHCDHTSCADVYFAECMGCAGCQAIDPAATFCPEHGWTTVVDGGSGNGFAGGAVYWAKLACGCTDVDESADVRAAV